MAKKVPLDRLRQISKGRRPQVLVRGQLDQQRTETAEHLQHHDEDPPEH